MFRLSLIELSFVCAVAALLLIAPAIFSWHLRRIRQRLDEIEQRLPEKK